MNVTPVSVLRKRRLRRRDRPHEARQLTRHRDTDLVDLHAAGAQPRKAPGEPHLCFPSHIANGLRQVLRAAQISSHCCWPITLLSVSGFNPDTVAAASLIAFPISICLSLPSMGGENSITTTGDYWITADKCRPGTGGSRSTARCRSLSRPRCNPAKLVATAALDGGGPAFADDRAQAGPRNEGLTTAEREELTRLRRQVRQLQMERDIRQANPRSQPRSMFQTILSCFPPPILDNGSSIYCSTAFQT